MTTPETGGAEEIPGLLYDLGSHLFDQARKQAEHEGSLLLRRAARRIKRQVDHGRTQPIHPTRRTRAEGRSITLAPA